MRRLLERAVIALYRYYRTDEDSKSAYRSALLVLSAGPILNVEMLCELLGLIDISGWHLTTDHRPLFAVSMAVILILIALGVSRLVPYDRVVADVTRASPPKHDLLITFLYLIGSVFVPVLVLMATKSLGW
jgi:hypothetical protein